MPKGPQGQQRPADVIGAAIRVARIATGEEKETAKPEPKKSAGGKLGGQNRSKTLTPEKRKKIAREAAAARWDKDSHTD